jgi:hypothetical protein
MVIIESQLMVIQISYVQIHTSLALIVVGDRTL